MAVFMFLFFNKSNAQFIDTIHIVYEKKMNMHQIIKKFGGEWMQDRIKTVDKYQVENYEFTGTPNQSIYKYKPLSEDEEPKRSALWGYSATDNIVFNNYLENKSTIYKTVYEDKVLIQDSTKKIDWKISNETRDIAGYKCRKATAIINDSVVVYAFYAQEFLCAGGPETFNGLPGMILGVAIPIMHTTWFATKIDTVGVKTNTITPPTKGKQHTYTSIYIKLNEALKDWGKMRHLYLWMNNI